MEIALSVVRLWVTLVTTLLSWQQVGHAWPLNGHRKSRETRYVERETELGILRGTRQSVLGRDLDVFHGIPYAKPPDGEERFQRPKMVEPWTGVKDATNLPASCQQLVDTSFGQFPGVQMWNPNTKMSEDCLTLNIWTPSDIKYGQSRAVMVWIFGGSFALGSSTLDVYDGRILAAQGDVVVVSMQYRIGALGFLYLGIPGAQGNMGLLDQQLALKWVYDYIGAFGGDQDRITVFGESAGAVSTSLHLFSPHSQPLFRAAIMQSGSALCPWAISTNETALQRTLELAKQVGCPTGTNKQDTLDCLKQVPAQNISREMWNIPANLVNIIAPISPIVDGYFLEEHPLDLLRKGEIKNTELMMGVDKDEGYYFLVYEFPKLFNISNPNHVATKEEYHKAVAHFLSKYPPEIIDTVAFEYGATIRWSEKPHYKDIMDDLLGDYAFKCPVIDFARFYAENEQQVYLYNFVHRTSANPWPHWMGVMHGYEIDHVFGAPLNASRKYSNQESQLSQEMITYWTNFAKSKNPNMDDEGNVVDVQWPTYTVDEPRHLVLNTTPLAVVDMGLRHRPCTMWREIVPKLKKAIVGNPGHGTCGACAVNMGACSLMAFFTIQILSTLLFSHS